MCFRGERRMQMTRWYRDIESPVGKLRLVADESALVAILWECDKAGRARFAEAMPGPDHAILDAAERELAEYFAGERTSFDVPLRPEGTEFQRRVWRELQQIPYGSSCSYGELARAIGRPTACRAVGAANGQNPLCIVVPCHRVIGQNGKLTGFAGGLEAKSYLLALEQRALSSGRRTVGAPSVLSLE